MEFKSKKAMFSPNKYYLSIGWQNGECSMGGVEGFASFFNL